MKEFRPLLVTLLCILLISLAAASCNSPVEPDPQPNPGGMVIAWFNGLGNTLIFTSPKVIRWFPVLTLQVMYPAIYSRTKMTELQY